MQYSGKGTDGFEGRYRESPISDAELSAKFQGLRKTLATKSLSGSSDPVDAVVAVLLDEIGSDLEILLIHRAERADDPWSGQIGLPGGRVRRTDLSTKDALRREVQEEVGVDVDVDGEELGWLSISSPMRNLDVKVQPWVFGLHRRPGVNVGQEVQNAFWVPLTRLPSLRSSAEIEIRGMKRTVEAFLVDGYIVWGFTHRVLNELLTIPGILHSS
ncbi:MAG TPA: CoA pyrophosphatase [Candidatus Bathyarchaeia archaeon]|nr:CoA pyrophosphatase [Candidatus Bathyarchaeia archaeon]